MLESTRTRAIKLVRAHWAAMCYLKDGSVLRGTILEQVPNETIKIRTRGGSVIVLKMSSIVQITKQLPYKEGSY